MLKSELVKKSIKGYISEIIQSFKDIFIRDGKDSKTYLFTVGKSLLKIIFFGMVLFIFGCLFFGVWFISLMGLGS